MINLPWLAGCQSFSCLAVRDEGSWLFLRWTWNLSCFPRSLYLTGTLGCHFFRVPKILLGASACVLGASLCKLLVSAVLKVCHHFDCGHSFCCICSEGVSGGGGNTGIYFTVRIFFSVVAHSHRIKLSSWRLFASFSLLHISSGHKWLHRCNAIIPLILPALSRYSEVFPGRS